MRLSEELIHGKLSTLPNELYAGIIFYNDGVPMLERCMKSCRKAGLKTIAIDGKFSAFKDDNKYFHSTDGCMEYAKENADIFIPSPSKGWHDIWGGQPAKRTAYLRAAKENDFILVIDADEALVEGTVIDRESLVYNFMKLRLYNIKKKHTIPNVRGYRVYNDLTYMNRHCAVYRTSFIDNKNDLYDGLAFYNRNMLKSIYNINGGEVIMENYESFRPEKRQQQDIEYMQSRSEQNEISIVNPSISRFRCGTINATSERIIKTVQTKITLEEHASSGRVYANLKNKELYVQCKLKALDYRKQLKSKKGG